MHANSRNIKILTIDDEDLVRMSISTYLEDCDFTVIEAENGTIGLEKFRSENPDIILTDLNMPNVHGLEVLDSVHKESPDTPVIILSGTGLLEDAVQSVKLGAWDFVEKPIMDMAILDNAIAKAVDHVLLAEAGANYQERLENDIIIRTIELKESNNALEEENNERKLAEEKLKELNEKLEERVRDRTHELSQANVDLCTSLEQLKIAQKQLVESAKMAALGGLVAGVAHEINTPVGIGVTAVSYLQEQVRIFQEKYSSGKLSRSDFEGFIDIATDSSQMIFSNLQRAATLIQSFKLVAVDQSHEELREFNMQNYIGEVLNSLRLKYKNSGHSIEIDCPDDLIITNYPGALAQVLTNLIMNSLIHGFEKLENRQVSISVTGKQDSVTINYKDNGNGMSKSTVKKIFDPFFTTRRGSGGSGLGMHIVYNIITQTMNGTIKCSSIIDKGTKFSIKIPNLKGKDNG